MDASCLARGVVRTDRPPPCPGPGPAPPPGRPPAVGPPPRVGSGTAGGDTLGRTRPQGPRPPATAGEVELDVLSPLDDYPVHQISEPMRHVGTSDRNFYDRY